LINLEKTKRAHAFTILSFQQLNLFTKNLNATSYSSSVCDAVVVTDSVGKVSFMSNVARDFTDWAINKATKNR
jgi:hypothetical protein